ncbi:13256_t:CDS:1 [Ambispora gerdemannii]|uniref:13256_t:CDS:1 n=1 Tax=Ambispora gerdemannii TaxID=144530 RepID=A0A9N9AFS8_9GLOM|nr:13256_t:CDS:1 [Ambispora gerdemannii]
MPSINKTQQNENNSETEFSLTNQEEKSSNTLIQKEIIAMEDILTQYELNILCEQEQSQIQPIPMQIPIIGGHMKTETRFWEFIIENETTTYIRYGNILSNGVLKERATQIQRHPSSKQAKAFVKMLIDEKVKAGYVGWTNFEN